ncbi:MAG: SAM-dependent methyltransferase [Nitrospiraceae bacterium]|nr:MAG: SAM-dependent methyltransferase [Nitrospiraceae bacterium]
MNPLEKIIIEKIKNNGPITFENFMDMSLYYPGLGYYASAGNKIGREGDFYTSPHLHPVFGAMIAKQLVEMWTFMEQPPVFHAIEMGAGTGYLCKDIIDHLNRSSSGEDKHFSKSLRYVIVEPYQYVEELQRKVIGKFDKNVMWVKSLTDATETFSEGLTGCILSNELLDAFPVHLIEMEDELKEIYVDFDGSHFIEVKNKVSSPELTHYLREFSASLQPGYRTEINLRIKDWLKHLNGVLAKGFIFTIDYGYAANEYYSEERSKGTLLCYHRHQANENPYQYIGEQDITAHVNFSSLKKWGEELGFKTAGYCPQGTFLVASGIDEVIHELYSSEPDYLFEIARIKGLIFPQGMGETHNIMVQYKGERSQVLRGFSLRNNAGQL